tara:strand:- start:457 stop:1101 length:645 start_codon:yes stop_codon:yes gene_type:complete
MNEWYHLWSKGGAVKNFEADNRALYISNFNWLNNWINVYFFNKVSDYLLGLIFLVILFSSFFFQKNLKYKIVFTKKTFLLYFILIILFLEWFYNHPSLRYGGYHLIALLIFIPSSIFLDNKIIFNNNLIKKINIILIIIIVTFLSRNINRISEENKIYNYNFIKNSSYNEDFKNYKIFERIEKIKQCNLDSNLCKSETIISTKILNKYIFYRKK